MQHCGNLFVANILLVFCVYRFGSFLRKRLDGFLAVSEGAAGAVPPSESPSLQNPRPRIRERGEVS